MGLTFDGAVGTGDPERDAAVITYFGDGATSQGDVDEAFDFAAVNHAPVVFFCQNNQYAISVPLARQTVVPIAQRAAGYGFRGVRVDGNDVLACHAVTTAALQQARDGGGPMLVEAFTYRMGAHTTSDDPSRYRSDDEVASWKAKDPIERVRAYLDSAGTPPQFFDRPRGRGRGTRRASSRAVPRHARARPRGAVRPRLRRADRRAARAEGRIRRLARPVRREPGMTDKMPIAKAINAGLRAALEGDDKVLIMGEDVGPLGGVFRVTDGLQKDFGESRVMDTPLAESGIVGTAIGLTFRGYRPWSRSSSTASSTRPTTRSSARSPSCTSAARATSACRSSSASRSAAASAPSSTTPRAPRGSSR